MSATPRAPEPAASGGRGAEMVWSVQYLRFAASTLVVILHASGALRQAGYRVRDVFDVGNAGVDVFFVVSGFVIVWVTAGDGPADVGRFVRARVLRVVPLYVLATLAAAAVLGGGENARGVANLARALAFMPIAVPGTDRYTSVYGPGWTLSAEVLFYALFAAALLLAPRRRVVAVAGALGALALAGAAGARSVAVVGFFTDPILLEFAAGMGVAVLVRTLARRRVRVPATPLLVAHVAAWVVLLGPGELDRDELGAWRVLLWGGPALVLVLTAVVLERASLGVPRLRLLSTLGDASYAVYLSHLFVVRICGEVWDRAGLTARAPAAALFAGSVVASLVAGQAVHRFVDVPLRHWLGRRWPVPGAKEGRVAAGPSVRG